MISRMAEQEFVEVTGFGSATTTPDRLRAHLAAVSGAPAEPGTRGPHAAITVRWELT